MCGCARLRAVGIAVRRADTFPGLTENHLRVAVRAPERAAVLVESVRSAPPGAAPKH